MILNLKDGFVDFNDPQTKHMMIDINAPVARSQQAKRAFRSFKDLIAATDSMAQLNAVKAIAGIDFSSIKNDDSKKEEPTIEEKASQFLSRGACVNKNISNDIVDIFFALAKVEPAILTVNDRHLAPVERDDLSAEDEILIASCYAVAFILS